MHARSLISLASIVAALAACGDSKPAKTVDSPISAKITSSSQLKEYGAQGLLSATEPGWHSQQPPKYPETVLIDFVAPQDMKHLDFLQQDGLPARAPKSVRIEMSDDGSSWTQVAASDDLCAANAVDGWREVRLAKPAKGRYLKVTIYSNCGDPDLLTLRGLRLG